MRKYCALCNSEHIANRKKFNVEVVSENVRFTIYELPAGSCIQCITMDLLKKYERYFRRLLVKNMQSELCVNWKAFVNADAKNRDEMKDLLVSLGFLRPDGKWDVSVGVNGKERSICPTGLCFVFRRDATAFGHEYNERNVALTSVAPRKSGPINRPFVEALMVERSSVN